MFCVGTYFLRSEEKEPSEGRLLILSADRAHANTQLMLKAATTVKGCVYALANVQGAIAAAVNSSVILFHAQNVDGSADSPMTLQVVGQWNHNYLVTQLAVYGNRLVVGDCIHSVSLLEVGPDFVMTTIARDYAPLWPIAVEASNESNIVGANVSSHMV